MRAGIFVDLSNLYHGAKLIYNKKVNYEAYYNFIKHNYSEVVFAKAYGTEIRNSAKEFKAALSKIGFTTIYKQTKVIKHKGNIIHKGNIDSHLVVDVMSQIDDFDTLVLGSADSDFVPLVNYLLKKGKYVLILACNISSDFPTHSKLTAMELHAGLME